MEVAAAGNVPAMLSAIEAGPAAFSTVAAVVTAPIPPHQWMSPQQSGICQ
jgi:hypothetical protein